MEQWMLESIATISVCILGVTVTVFFYFKDKKRQRLSDVSKQIVAYWCLEKEYCNEITNLRNAVGDTSKYKLVLEEFRKKAEENPLNVNHIRPTYTAQQVKRHIS
jgi:hypothetical protein